MPLVRWIPSLLEMCSASLGSELRVSAGKLIFRGEGPRGMDAGDGAFDSFFARSSLTYSPVRGQGLLKRLPRGRTSASLQGERLMPPER